MGNNNIINSTEIENKNSIVSTDNSVEIDSQNKYKFNENVSEKPAEQKSEFDKNRDFQNKLRKFKMSSSGKIAEYRKREAYDSPSVKRKKKSKEARRRNKKRSFVSSRRNGF